MKKFEIMYFDPFLVLKQVRQNHLNLMNKKDLSIVNKKMVCNFGTIPKNFKPQIWP